LARNELSAGEHTERFLADIGKIAALISPDKIDRIVALLREVRDGGGRVFFLGVGGGAGYASHAVNDFRKIAGIESYTPSDNVSELTARVNDDGWETAYSNWLRGSRLNSKDAVFVFSVGGGDVERNISANIVKSLQVAKEVGAKVAGIVGRDGGYTAAVGDEVVVIPVLSAETVTPYTEAFQAVIWHCIVNHPELKLHAAKWESQR
jgi:D-sedoheptulose 7-phosphate isomerase